MRKRSRLLGENHSDLFWFPESGDQNKTPNLLSLYILSFVALSTMIWSLLDITRQPRHTPSAAKTIHDWTGNLALTRPSDSRFPHSTASPDIHSQTRLFLFLQCFVMLSRFAVPGGGRLPIRPASHHPPPPPSYRHASRFRRSSISGFWGNRYPIHCTSYTAGYCHDVGGGGGCLFHATIMYAPISSMLCAMVSFFLHRAQRYCLQKWSNRRISVFQAL